MQTVEVQAMIAQGEGPGLEFKLQADHPAQLAKAMAALANSQGGVILIGVDDGGQVVGADDPDLVERKLRNAGGTNCQPPLYPQVEHIEVEGRCVIAVQVGEGLEKPYQANNLFYVRHGAESRPASADKLLRLFQERGKFAYDRTLVWEARFDHLDRDKVERYLDERGPSVLDTNGRSPAALLGDLGLLQRQEGEWLPTVATVLLFARHPQRFLPHSSLKVARFKGQDTNGWLLDQAELMGQVGALLERGVAFVRRNMKVAAAGLVNGVYRREIPEYPDFAVREALTNAVAHRDYAIAGRKIEVRMFDDRLEVASPGGLVGGLRSNDLGTGRHYSRNPTLAGVMHEYGLIEEWGLGLRRIQRELAALGSRPARFEVTHDTFTLTLPSRHLDLPV